MKALSGWSFKLKLLHQNIFYTQSIYICSFTNILASAVGGRGSLHLLSSDLQPDALTTRLRRRVYLMGKIRAILRYHDFDDLKKINIGKCWVLIQPTLAMG
jgi:hypothetical protein